MRKTSWATEKKENADPTEQNLKDLWQTLPEQGFKQKIQITSLTTTCLSNAISLNQGTNLPLHCYGIKAC